MFSNNIHQELFDEYCRLGELSKAKKVWKETRGICLENAYHVLCNATIFNVSIFRWLLSLNVLPLKIIERSFSHACGTGNRKLVNTLHRRKIQRMGIRTDTYYLDEYVYIHSLFNACKHGQLDMAHYLIHIYPLLKRVEYLDQAKNVAHFNNQIHIVEWLEKLNHKK